MPSVNCSTTNIAPVLFSHIALGRIAADFIVAYPDVRLETTAEDRMVDLIEEGYDAVIRANPKPDSDLVGRCFLRDQVLIVAPASMIRPNPGDAIPPVPAVVLNDTPDGVVWSFSEGGRAWMLTPDPILRLPSLHVVRDAVRNGAGTAMLPRSIVDQDLSEGRLVCWGQAPGRDVEVWVLHTSRRLMNARVKAFVQFLCDAFPDATLRPAEFATPGRR